MYYIKMGLTHDDKVSFIKKVFGACHESHDGRNVAVQCPSQKCKTSGKKKLAIELDSDIVNCWVCGLRGRLVTVLINYKGAYVHEYVTKFSHRTTIHRDEVQAKEVELPAGFKLLAPIARTDRNVSWAVDYLYSRGLTERDLWYFKFGVSTDRSMFKRVVMPSFDADGKLNYFTGRAVEQSSFMKYLNCDAEKKSIVFNELNVDWKNELTLVEGPFDLTKCDDNATCLLGSSLNEDFRLFSLIFQHKTPVILALDNDMVDKSWQKIAKMLSNYDIPVKMINTGQFKDIGEMTRSQFVDAKLSAVTWDRDSALLKKIGAMRI